MTEGLLVGLLLGAGIMVAVFLIPRSSAAMMVAPRRSGFRLPESLTVDACDGRGRIPYYPAPLPEDATHVAFIVMGQCEHGSVYSLAVQDIEAAAAEVQAATYSHDPVIRKMVELEDDLLTRGCSLKGDIHIAIVHADDDGTEKWWSGSKWVPRWHRSAALFNLWGERA